MDTWDVNGPPLPPLSPYLIAALTFGSSMRLGRSGLAAYAAMMTSRSLARMMHPPQEAVHSPMHTRRLFALDLRLNRGKFTRFLLVVCECVPGTL